MPQHKRIIYTYDMGDNWKHEIELMRIIEDYDEESPYLLEAKGQAPPEDVGGVWGFLNFCEIMANPSHLRHEEMREWARYWTPELNDWQVTPRVIRV